MNGAPEIDRWSLIQDIFQGALERPPAERSRYLASMCGDDESLRSEVASLLANDDDGTWHIAALEPLLMRVLVTGATGWVARESSNT